jgi:cytoskeletal protein CcmA (bactofilin family)
MNIIKHLRITTKRGLLLLFVLVLLPIFLIISPATSNNNAPQKPVIIDTNQVIDDDLYLAGDNLTIDGTIKGDAVLAGNKITLNGTVEGDLIAAAQTITINGSVRDDVRIAGQVLTLDSKARIGDDLIAAGLSLENKAGSSIGGDVNFLGNQALLAGAVQRNVLGVMNSLEVRGTVGRNMQITAIGDPNILTAPFIPKTTEIPKLQPGLTLTDSAKIGGKLTYKSISTGQISQQATVAGGTVREEIPYGDNTSARADRYLWLALQQLQRFGALLLIGWLLLRFVPGWTQRLAATVQAQPLPSLGWGILTSIGIGITTVAIVLIAMLLTVIFAFTLPNLILPVISISTLANITLWIGFAIFASYVPQIALSFLGGRWLMYKLQPDRPSGRFLTLVVGLAAFIILTSIPVLGGILQLIVVLLGVGAVWLWGETKFKHTQDRQLTPV